MPVIYGAVGAPSNTSAADSTNLPILQGKQTEMITSELHGKYYTQTYRGNTFWAATALAGLTLSIVTATTNTCFAIWNPQGSGKNLSLMSVTITPTTAMTTASGYGYGFLLNAGAAIGTAAPISAITLITATRGPGLLNNSGVGTSVAIVAGAMTLTSASLAMRGMGGSAGTGAITAPAQQPTIREDFDGTMIIPPGTVFFVGTTVASSGQTATGVSAVWEETPL